MFFNNNNVVTRLKELGSTRQENHDCSLTTINPLAAHCYLSLSHIHPPLNRLITRIKSTQVILTTFTDRFAQDFEIYQKCLPKLLRRSPPLVARPQLVEKYLPRRRKLARRPQRQLVIRRSATRRAKKLTLPTSTKVQFSTV